MIIRHKSAYKFSGNVRNIKPVSSRPIDSNYIPRTSENARHLQRNWRYLWLVLAALCINRSGITPIISLICQKGLWAFDEKTTTILLHNNTYEFVNHIDSPYYIERYRKNNRIFKGNKRSKSCDLNYGHNDEYLVDLINHIQIYYVSFSLCKQYHWFHIIKYNTDV